MLGIAAFWLLLWIPGYTALRRFRPQALEGGILSAASLGYLASFALLSPISIAGYLWHLPLEVLSVAIVLAVVIGAFFLIRDLIRTRTWPRFELVEALAVLVIVTDMVMGLRAGGYLNGDARFHIARIRMLLSYGFNSWDAVLPGHKLEAAYHSNLYHALMASAAQLTRQEAPEAWVFTWFWAKLFAAAGIFQLAYAVMGQRYIAATAAAMFAVHMASYSVVSYPNTIAVYGLMTLGLAFLVEALTGKPSFWPAIGLGALCVVLVEWHALYYVFACFTLAPLLFARAGWLRLRRRPGQRQALAALLALALGAPWFAVKELPRMRAWLERPALTSQQAPASAAVAAPAPAAARSYPAWMYADFVQLEGGRLMIDPAQLTNPRGPQLQLFLMLLLGLISTRRRQFAIIAAATTVVVVGLYVPAICTKLVSLADAPWVVRRWLTLLVALHLAFFPGTVAFLLLEQLARWPRVVAGLRLLALCAGLALAYVTGVNSSVWLRSRYLSQARTGQRATKSTKDMRDLHQFFSDHIAREAVVAMQPRLFRRASPLCDCYPLAIPQSNRGDRGQEDMPARRAALHALLNWRTPLAERVVLARRYNVSYLLMRDGSAANSLRRSYGPLLVSSSTGYGMMAIGIDPSRYSPPRDLPGADTAQPP
jgi:hypothetical protein